ncbi:hypothetical protein PBI_MIMI_196 [Arthrobacter phage Mimi]|nr:hypothetical protein PBI_MIMI_276 [Arthrobacter phage Mimi]
MKNLTLESTASDFEQAINPLITELEYNTEVLENYKATHASSGRRVSGDDSELYFGFYLHVKHLKKILELLKEAEEFANDMADEPEDGDYARGQLMSLKQVFLAVWKDAKLQSEVWFNRIYNYKGASYDRYSAIHPLTLLDNERIKGPNRDDPYPKMHNNAIKPVPFDYWKNPNKVLGF